MAEVPKAGDVFRSEDGTTSTVLPDQACDPNYEPSQEDLEDYAANIGIDVAKEPHLMWIAKEGLRAALPPEWRACETDADEMYYFNFQTGESMWDHPLDDTFREKVVKEREALRAGGGERRGAPEKRSTAPGATKAISATLFGSPTSGATSNAGPGRLPMQKQTRLESLGALTQLPDGGVVAPAGVPDPSEFLKPPTPTVSSPGNNNSVNSAFGGAHRALPLPFPKSHTMGALGTPNSSTTSAAPLAGPKDIEAAIRKRVEDEIAPQRRAANVEAEKKLAEERQRLDAARKQLQEDLDKSWKTYSENGAQRQMETARAVKQIEESWEKRLVEVTAKLTELRAAEKTKKDEVAKAKGQTTEELRKALREKKEAELRRIREAAQAEQVKQLSAAVEANNAVLEELQKRNEVTVAAARTRAEGEQQRRLDQLRVELLEAQQNASKPAARGPAKTPPTPSVSPATASAVEPDEAEIAKVTAECAAAMEKLKETYAEKRRKLEEDLKKSAAPVGKSPPAAKAPPGTAPPTTKGTPTTGSPLGKSIMKSPLAAALSVEEEKKLREEEERLQAELNEAKKTYAQQTATMLQQCRGSLPDSGLSTPTTPSPWGLPRQEQRAKDAENARHDVAMKQLEMKHEQVVRQIREAHQRSLQEKAKFDPRKHPDYAKGLTERKRAWLTAHPAPSLVLPTLDPVPKLSSMIGDVPAVPMPDEDEQKKMIEGRLRAVRAESAAQQQKSLSDLEVRKRAELETLKENYREARLKEVRAGLAKRQEELKRNATSSATTDADSAEHAKQVAAMKALEDRIRQEDAAHHTQKEALTAATHKAHEQQKQAEAALAASTARQTPAAAPNALEYMSQKDADAAESTLVSRWKARLDGLRQSIAEEAERYEAACRLAANGGGASEDGKPPAMVATTPVGSASGLPDSITTPRGARLPMERPPTAPVYGNNSAVSLLAFTGTASSATPLNRSAVADDELRRGDPAAATVAPSLMASSIHPVPFGGGDPHRGSRGGLPAGVGVLGMSPATSHNQSALFSPSFLLSSPVALQQQHLHRDPVSGAVISSGVVPAMSSPFVYHGDSAGGENGSGGALAPSMMAPPPSWLYGHSATGDEGWALPNAAIVQTRRDATHEQRLQRLRTALRERRQQLRLCQQELEDMRVEWRRDMEECKQNRDREKAYVLRDVKRELEDRAKELNRAVLELKSASRRLKAEETLYMNHLNPTHADGGGAGSGGINGGPSGYNEGQDVVVSMLMDMVERTERLETLVLTQALDEQRTRQPSRRRSGERLLNASPSPRGKSHNRRTLLQSSHAERDDVRGHSRSADRTRLSHVQAADLGHHRAADSPSAHQIARRSPVNVTGDAPDVEPTRETTQRRRSTVERWLRDQTD